jgi:Thioredoxin
MEHPGTGAVPSGHTKGGGVLIGSDRAPRQLVLFEDPQCPYCRQFEEASGELLRRLVDAEAVAIEYRMRCFLGVESVRADNALALAAEAGRFDDLRRQMFADQPAENTGGYTVDDLVDRGRQVGLSSPDYQQGVRDERYARWVVGVDRVFQRQDPNGTPAGLLDGRKVPAEVLYDPATLRRMIQPD